MPNAPGSIPTAATAAVSRDAASPFAATIAASPPAVPPLKPPTATKRPSDQQMRQAAEQIRAMTLPAKLEHLCDCLNTLHDFIEAKASSAERSSYTRASIAAVAALDCAVAQSRVFAETFPNLSPEIVTAVTTLLHFAGPVPRATSRPGKPRHRLLRPQAFDNRLLVDKHFQINAVQQCAPPSQ